MAINRDKTGDYNFTELISQRVQRKGQVTEPTTCRGCHPYTRSRQSADITLISGIQPVRVPYNNVEYDKKEDDISRNNIIKLDKEYNAFVYFQKNNYDSDEYKYVNDGYDNIFVDNLVWEDIDGNIFVLDIPYHYCGTKGFKGGVGKLFQTVPE